MKLTDLKIGQFATRNWYSQKPYSSLCIKKKPESIYEYWEDSKFSSTVRENSSALKHNDFELCDCNGKLIKEFTYPLFMESIYDKSVYGRIVKFNSLTTGTVITKGMSNDLAGQRRGWSEHTNTNHWKPCDFTKAPDIDDLDYWDSRYNAGLPIYFSFNSNNNDKLYRLFDTPSISFCEDMKFHIPDELESEFNYPMYFECIENKMIVKFTDLEKGILVKESKNGIHKIDNQISNWFRHTDEKIWKQVNFDEDLNKIIPDEDDIYELISNLKSIIKDRDNRFSPSEYGAGTQLRKSSYEACQDIADEWLEKYHLNKAPNIEDQEYFKYYEDLADVIIYMQDKINEDNPSEELLKDLKDVEAKMIYCDHNPFDEIKVSKPYNLGIDYASEQDISFVPQNGLRSRLHDDRFDALSLSYAAHLWENKTGAGKTVNNLNQTKEFTMTKELQEAILELIATNGQPKVKKPKTPKIVCNVEGTLMEFADEAALKSFIWSSRVESVIRYDLSGKVTVPFELSVEAPKKQKSVKSTEFYKE